MNRSPKWLIPVAVIALIWNLLGCMAFLFDVTITPADVAKMSSTEQAMYEARPAWAVAATAVAVWLGSLGSLGLILRKRWALLLLVCSLCGVVVQDIALFIISGFASQMGTMVYVLQGIVLITAIGLLLIAYQGTRRQWLS